MSLHHAQQERKISWQDLVEKQPIPPAYKADDEHSTPRTGSSFGAYFNVVCVIAGVGTLQLPYALSQSGWIGVGLILLSAAIAIYTGNLLIQCLYSPKDGSRLHGYADIGEAAFGKFGRIFVQFFHYAILLGAACVYIMLSGINLNSLFELVGIHLGLKTWILISAAIIWVPFAALKSLKEVAVLSVFGALTTLVVVVVTVVLSGIQLASPEQVHIKHSIVNPSQLPIALASISFSFGGNVVYPHVEATMRHPGSWKRVLTAAIATICAMYLLIAIPAYAAYGHTTQSPVLSSLPNGPATSAAVILITAHVILAAPILMTSFSMEMEHAFHLDVPYKTPRAALLIRVALRTAIAVVLAIVAMFIPFFGDFMSLIGALANCMIVFVLPVVCYIKLYGRKVLPWYEQLFCVIIIVVGMIGCVLGAADAIRSLVADFSGVQSSVPKVGH